LGGLKLGTKTEVDPPQNVNATTSWIRSSIWFPPLPPTRK
jgi:hypothetical protein